MNLSINLILVFGFFNLRFICSSILFTKNYCSVNREENNYCSESFNFNNANKFSLVIKSNVQFENYVADMNNIKEEFLPSITLVIFMKYPVLFFEEFIQNILIINYPKKRIDEFLYCNIEIDEKFIQNFSQTYSSSYNTIGYFLTSDKINEQKGRLMTIEKVKALKNDYLFVVDSNVQIEDPDILKDLISFNKTFIAPVLSEHTNLKSNIIEKISSKTSYTSTYINIVKGNKKGIWNVSHVSSCYLIKQNAVGLIDLTQKDIENDVSFCKFLKEKQIDLNVVNIKNYGHLVDANAFELNLVKPEFYSLLKNPKDWIKRYIHPDYLSQLNPDFQHEQPCPDVFWFPIVKEKFCDDLIAIAENFGKWTGGTYHKGNNSNNDPVPTSDIYMEQVGLHDIWLKFLNQFVRPLQQRVYPGHDSNPTVSLVNFIVRYKTDEQSFLRPHHDTSTYTINIALNKAGIDFTGGGCNFVRYNCSVVDTKKGWMLMHPGQLTHMHEGLNVLSGTRYIMVSFVDPR